MHIDKGLLLYCEGVMIVFVIGLSGVGRYFVMLLKVAILKLAVNFL
jgi:hypothetical protein